MKIFGKAAALIVAGSLTLTACETNEQMGQVIGGLLGAGLGAAVAGDDDDTMKVLAIAAGAAAGAWIGGNIGRGLDEKEREKLAQSTQNVLNAPVPRNSPLRAANAAEAPQNASYAPSSTWVSPTNPKTVSGKTTLLQVSDNSSGGECRTVRQLVVKNGNETYEDVKMCKQTASSGWQQVNA